MKAPLSTVDCHEVMDRFDSYLDGDLDAQTAARFEHHLHSCSDCAAEHAVAERMNQALGGTALEPCPDDVFVRAVAAVTTSENGQADRPPLAGKRLPGIFRWKALALAATVLVMFGLGSLPFLLNRADDEFSAEEIAQARMEVEFALGLVSNAGRETGVFLRNDILNDEVVQPIQRTISPIP